MPASLDIRKVLRDKRLHMLLIRRLVWDSKNVAHIARHEVLPEDVEQLCHDKPLFEAGKLGRLLVLGPVGGGRMVTAVLDETEDPGVYYVVTARAASRRERRVYAEQTQGQDGGYSES